MSTRVLGRAVALKAVVRGSRGEQRRVRDESCLRRGQAKVSPWLSFEFRREFQFMHGAGRSQCISPDPYMLDQALLDRPGNDAIQLKLCHDYYRAVSRALAPYDRVSSN